MAEILVRSGELLPWLAGGVSLFGGIITLMLAASGRFRGRKDGGAAAAVAITFGLLAGAIAGTVVAMIGSAWAPGGVEPAAFVLGAGLFGTPVFVVVAAASLTGYLAMTRVRPSANAAAGAVLGPLVLGALALGAVALVQAGQQVYIDAQAAGERSALQERSRSINLTVQSVDATLDAAGLVSAVRLRVSLRSDTDLPMEQLPEKFVYPRFVLQPSGEDDPNTELQADAPNGSPASLAAGVEHVYDLVIDVDAFGAQRSAPGTWRLLVVIGGSDGQTYGVEASVEVGP